MQRKNNKEFNHRKKCPFVPCHLKIKEKKDVIEISQRLYKTGLKHLKTSSSTPNNFMTEDMNRKSYFVEKSFNSNNNRANKS